MDEKKRMFSEEEAKKAAEAIPDFVGEKTADAVMELIMTSMEMSAKLASMPECELTEVERKFMKASTKCALNFMMMSAFMGGR